MSSILFKSKNTTKVKIYIMILLLFIVYGICGCYPKNVAHEYISKDSQYIPREMAIEYLNDFFDTNIEGILLKNKCKGFITENCIYKRFPFQDTIFMVEKTGKFYCIIVKHKDNLTSNYMRGFYADTSLIESHDKVKKICTALLSLGGSPG